jgi:8-oxo-dGTP diphosphatase
MGRETARALVVAAGGIVLREQETPLFAVVRLRKRDQWVLPKGKLDDSETPRDAAEREVLEETGHDVAVHEFLGTLVYESGGRSKVVHYWRMAAEGAPSRELMDDVTAVDWLPLDAALERLSRSSERAFLANVGPLALAAAALARPSRRPKAKPRVSEKRPSRPAVAPRPSPVKPAPPSVASDVVEIKASAGATEFGPAAQCVEAVAVTSAATLQPDHNDIASPAEGWRRNVIQKLRDWLRRTA